MTLTTRIGHTATVRLAFLLCATLVYETCAGTEVPIAKGLSFSDPPADAELSAARVFDEPLVPLNGDPGAAENRALARALTAYSDRSTADDCSSLADFADGLPQSRWTGPLLLHLGVEYYNYGYYSKALDAWERAWALLQPVQAGPAKAEADRALGELARMYSRIGRMTELNHLLDSVENRDLTGPGAQLIHEARDALWMMKNQPGGCFCCGPLALHKILNRTAGLSASANSVFEQYKSPTNGFSLPQVAELSGRLGLNYQMASRAPGAAFIVPSVIHWKVGHYAAVLEQRGDRLLVQDFTFLGSIWMTTNALEQESSGYFLVPPGPLPAGWRTVSSAEGQNVWGRGKTNVRYPKANCKCVDKSAGGSSCSTCDPCAQGMTTYSMHALLVSLSLEDTPVRFKSPVGEPMEFTANYNQLEADQPANFYYSNLGPLWDCSLLSYVEDNPTSPGADLSIYMDGGGELDFGNFNPATQTYAPEVMTQALLVMLTTNSYELRYPDGSRREYAQSDGSTGSSRRVFLTEKIDPFGNAVKFNYDSELRITQVVNPIGQAMTLAYTNTAYPFLITSVSDPFGRTAQLLYNSSGMLIQITDVLGLVSQYTYGANGFITALTTPYGTTTFTTGTNPAGDGNYLTATDPLGGTEAMEYSQSLPVPDSLPAAQVPHGLSTFNLFLSARDSFYWDKREFAEGAWDVSKCHIYHWLHLSPSGDDSARILESEKDPLVNRIYYNYPGQPTNGVPPYYLDAAYSGSSGQPSLIARVLDDGATQTHSYAYSAFGNVTNATDPLGRSFTFVYDTNNNIDCLQTYMTHSGKHELLNNTAYNSQHLPISSTDASGQTTTTTYNARGQPSTVTDAANSTTTFTYDSNGFLVSIQGPLSGVNDTTTFTYDSDNRILTSTDPEGFANTYTYDDFDRPLLISYPDGTSEQFVYDRLDLVAVKDRLGRWTTNTYNANRQLVSTLDPLGRLTRFQWCSCGLLEAVIDPMGRQTTFSYDLQSRPIGKQYADGSVETLTYENASGRLHSRTDAEGNQTVMEYNADDTIERIYYLGGTNVTPTVTFAYDPDYRRVTSIQDGIGTTLFTYKPITPVPSLGAALLQSVSGPLPNSTVTYEYDLLGRVISTAINGAVQTAAYDAIGRPTVKSNSLGAFRFSYLNSTALLTAASYPNGQTNLYSYYGVAQDQRLKQITNLKPNSSVLSSFGYAYDALGQITSWTNAWDTLPTRVWDLAYDAAGQLTGATQTGDPNLPAAEGFAYDSAGNRTQASAGAGTNSFSFNDLNQLASSTGLTNAPTYEWDAAERLVAINVGTHRTEFSYDGLGRRARIVEKAHGAVVSDNYYLWSGTSLCEERDSTGGTVVRRFFPEGESLVGAGTTNLYYTRDHLGSVREALDGNGTLQARYDYDLYGQQTALIENIPASFGFTGHFLHRPSGLDLTMLRALDPRLGRWLSRDPNGEITGLNLYAYVGNDPINGLDPLGDKDAIDKGLEWFSNLTLGAGDAATGGFTKWLRRKIYGPCWDPVDYNSLTYRGSHGVVTVLGVVAGGKGVLTAAGKGLAAIRGAAQATTLLAEGAEATTLAAEGMEAGAAVPGEGASWVSSASEGGSWVGEASEGTSWVGEASEGTSWVTEGAGAGSAGSDTVIMTAAEFRQMAAAESAARAAASLAARRAAASGALKAAWANVPPSCRIASVFNNLAKIIAARYHIPMP